MIRLIAMMAAALVLTACSGLGPIRDYTIDPGRDYAPDPVPPPAP